MGAGAPAAQAAAGSAGVIRVVAWSSGAIRVVAWSPDGGAAGAQVPPWYVLLRGGVTSSGLAP